MKKIPKKPTKKQLKTKLWKLVSQYVRSQETHCYTCDKYIPDKKDRHAGHYWTKKGHPRTTFDLMNVHVQCLSCNSFKSGNISYYSARLLRDYGLELYQDLEARAKDSRPFTALELEQMIENLNQLIQ